MIITLPSLHDSQKLLSYAERDRVRAQKDRPVLSWFACVCVREKSVCAVSRALQWLTKEFLPNEVN